MTCPICHGDFNENDMYILPECDHMFHTDCIISWFRQGNSTCPYCNNPGETNPVEEKGMFPSLHWSRNRIHERVKMVKNRINKDQFPEIKGMISRLDIAKERLKILQKEKKDILTTVGEFKELKKKSNRIRTNIWNIDTTIRKLENKICVYPIQEIIVVKKKYI